jgi:hypothetical protein
MDGSAAMTDRAWEAHGYFQYYMYKWVSIPMGKGAKVPKQFSWAV